MKYNCQRKGESLENINDFPRSKIVQHCFIYKLHKGFHRVHYVAGKHESGMDAHKSMGSIFWWELTVWFDCAWFRLFAECTCPRFWGFLWWQAGCSGFARVSGWRSHQHSLCYLSHIVWPFIRKEWRSPSPLPPTAFFLIGVKIPSKIGVGCVI